LSHATATPVRVLLVGATLALLVGWLPAALYASSATESKIGLIRREVELSQSGTLTPEQWGELMPLRRDAVARMESARTRIAVTMFVLWAMCGGLGLYAWYRLVMPRLPAAAPGSRPRPAP
jgi:F0F1-type ATP synthase membrane subunit c/vacuolar-type H+-ATPase subunit K